jgi:hypothetical protein
VGMGGEKDAFSPTPRFWSLESAEPWCVYNVI